MFPVGSGNCGGNKMALTWQVFPSAEQNEWTGLAWSPSLLLFAAVSQTGTNRVMTSPDGENWTARSAPSKSWQGICWAEELGLFVAVADSGGTSTTRVMTSPDGITWTSQTTPVTSGLSGVAWSASVGLLVAVGYGSPRVLTSPDGTTWTSGSATFTSGHTRIIWAEGLGLYVICGGGNGSGPFKTIATSPDGTNFTDRDASPNVVTVANLAWSPSLGTIVGVSAISFAQVITSPDAASWTGRTEAALATWLGVAWGPLASLFVAGSYEGQIQSSSDGVTWALETVPEANPWLRGTWSPELRRFCFVAYDSGTNRVLLSDPLPLPPPSATGETNYVSTPDGACSALNYVY